LPSSVGFTQLVRIVHLADNLVRREGIGYSGYQHLSDVDRLAAGLGLDAPGVTEVLDRLPAMMEPFSELVGLDDSDHRSDNTVSLMAANRQLGQLNAKLTEANRYLQTRSACLAALEQFTRRCCDRDGISDVCVASAQSVRTMAEADCAVAFFSEPSSCCIHIGCAAAREQDETASVIDPGELRDLLDAGVCSCDVPPRGLAEASTGFDVLWQRCVGTPPSDPLWILPVLTGPGPTAGVLVAAPQEAVGRLRSASQECDALSSAIRLGMTSARNRAGSERMNEELLDLNRRVQAAQKELVHARSLAMIAKMADGAAHELNNPLAVVSGRAQMALQACRDEETVRALKTIKDQAERAARIVSDLMRFAKPDPPSPVEQSLVGLLESLCQHWRSGSAPCSDAPTVAVVDPAATVYADTNHLHQMLEAVLANAMEATQPETARVHVNSPSRASDETVRIVVEDNGVGMARDVLEHAVDPFFSGRTAGRGQGLGLSHAYRLAEINGGRLWLQSAPGIGTTVTIELPAYAPRL
jgi:signal transduction histidine kinase